MLRHVTPAVFSRAPAGDGEAAAPLARGGYLGWVAKVWTASAEEEIEAAGLDGWGLLQFYRMNFRLLSTLGAVLLAVLLPLHGARGLHSREDTTA